MQKLVEKITGERKIGAADHAVGLCDAGKASKRKQDQYKETMLHATPMNAACYLKQAVIECQKALRNMRERFKENIEQIEKDHIAAKLCHRKQAGYNRVIHCFQERNFVSYGLFTGFSDSFGVFSEPA